MRRFSQRNSLVTLNEINITPLLDLAFVLLIIFVITRPALEQSMNLSLPREAKVAPLNEKIEPKDIQTVEIDARGNIRLHSRSITLKGLEPMLADYHKKNPKMIVHIRADERSFWEVGVHVMHICSRNKIRVAVDTVPEK